MSRTALEVAISPFQCAGPTPATIPLDPVDVVDVPSCLGAFRPPAFVVRGETVIPAAENLHICRRSLRTCLGRVPPVRVRNGSRYRRTRVSAVWHTAKLAAPEKSVAIGRVPTWPDLVSARPGRD